MANNPPPATSILRPRRFTGGIPWPGNSATQGLFAALPWIDAAVIALIFIALLNHTILLPGRFVDLPQAPFTEGHLQSGLIAIVQPVNSPDGIRETLLFLDDERYSSLRPDQLDRLGESIRSLAADANTRTLNLLIDGSVPMAETSRWINRLRDAGIQQINLVEKPR